MNLRLAAYAITAAALVGGGWFARGWLEDAERLTALQAANAAIDAAMARESRIAQGVEQRLAKLQASERVIDRGIIREIEKPVYRRVCLEHDAIRLLNAAAQGRAPDPAEPADTLPRDAAATE
ncbi:hypothetical protein L861_08900 [Litchfieldella anticariensis FP35 = DSM 16096]|uniref:Uncharacterized protein n=1 Tax=Litchfieldella anticariensis (strain DSM 16096 / CECT 5854 / CIP 108499 / LMG 22089 / FP35) TaxID=1121939 RepID=S2KPS6_LITA3|nr:hypothetical protein [Halomonas anticariensis]EPC02473.1 hypothetical protein L861_08900 [Halomonas anticariensis FP35 = DSM 16096]